MNHNEFSATERREHDRYSAGLFVKIVTNRQERYFYSRNVSAGGIFLLSDRPISEETMVEMEILLPKVKCAVAAEGEVVWQRHRDPKGFAIKFTKADQSLRQLLGRLAA